MGDLKGAVGREGGPTTSFKGPWSGGKKDGEMTSESFRTKEMSSLACGVKKTNPSSLDADHRGRGWHPLAFHPWRSVGSLKSLAALQTSPRPSGLFVPLGHYLKIKIRSKALSESHSDSHGD